MSLLKEDVAVLRQLVAEYAQIAAQDVQKKKVELWKALNRGSMQRPMVLIDQLPWNELEASGELCLKVTEPYFRALELKLRQTLYKWKHFPVDMVIEPFITLPMLVTSTAYGLDVHEKTAMLDPENTIVSHNYQNQIQEPEDLAKIKDMELTHDKESSLRYLEEARAAFGDILPVKLEGMHFQLCVWDSVSTYMGIEDIYYDLVDRPEFMFKLAERMYASLSHGIDRANELAIHDDVTSICHCSHIYTDELLPAPGESKGPYSQNCWAFGMAQLFSSVSPQVTQEYELDLLKKLAPKFGMLYYGCCERLDDRVERIREIPNVRKISCSPWSDREIFAEKLGPTITMSNKPNPAFLAVEHPDFDAIRKDLEYTCDVAKRRHVNLEFILKDVSTACRRPEHLTKWAEIAMETVCSMG